MTEHFTQGKSGYINAIGTDGEPLSFRPQVNIIRDVPGTGTVEMTVGNGATVVVQGSAAEYLEYLDPTPVEPQPPVDITNGRLRIQPAGSAIAFQLDNDDPRGDWQVYVIGSETMYFTTNEDNPDITSWPYLRVDTGE
ncbi:hypothetical protein PP568_13335 [Mycobacteroides abscessus]|jgi:hypothetical protein|uniref:Bacteriophage protein n=1 Tax=Mycobacteroides abscessus subsp. abscessus TaxID=1185650 RepID=A0AB38D4E7_9MYCO|nr:hypothetical protein [Mycobacteroides abscessus]QSM03272.1 hypothetical protein PROPHIGD102-2_70 [Mycobacterium phage prophi102-2]QSM04044.1 hypothetical protein PROPHIGD54-1_70 [Mycobacterium phage prophiGD54-1]MBE5420132.1 hypothetical protein [Mycobacteroides abscessus]MBE5455169.1 hypothetical protein [Mycobacteroides abscessus]MBE5500475.1 hypothetical protein [Mycobacteroides abscessus]